MEYVLTFLSENIITDILVIYAMDLSCDFILSRMHFFGPSMLYNR